MANCPFRETDPLVDGRFWWPLGLGYFDHITKDGPIGISIAVGRYVHLRYLRVLPNEPA